MSNVGVEGCKNPSTPIFLDKKVSNTKIGEKYSFLDNTNKPIQVGFFS